jgi:hypothetical protein
MGCGEAVLMGAWTKILPQVMRGETEVTGIEAERTLAALGYVGSTLHRVRKPLGLQVRGVDGRVIAFFTVKQLRDRSPST